MINVLYGSMLEILPTLEENSFDSCVCDPPYELGFMGKKWDSTGIAFNPETWAHVYRVLKPGAHLLAFSGTRTYHRIACAIEDAGFHIRDTLMWLYAKGMPKSRDISRDIDKRLGVEREVLAYVEDNGKRNVPITGGGYTITKPESELAKAWDGWGTGLKPAVEPIVMARKPLQQKTVAENVVNWGTGAISIDKCRIGTKGGTKGCTKGTKKETIFSEVLNGSYGKKVDGLGRWPANLLLSDDEEIQELFGDKCRFFYSAKAGKKDRNGSKHPTIKPISLMQYLCRLVTPPGGHVLDPFAGTGTTGIACKDEGFSCTLIEQEKEYIMDIYRRFEEKENVNV